MITTSKKVLLAEHEKNIAEILIYLLTAWDYEIVTVSDGASVFDAVRREQPDIIIIDYNLPKLDGLTVSKLLKEDFLTAHMPVIILIDKKQIRKKMLEIEQGVDDYILKPPDPIDLEVRMEMALRRTTHQLHANALTRLPGNRQIEKIIQSKIEGGGPFSFLYYDIDNFKSFNDKYGYMKGDNVLRQVAYIISKTIKKHGNKGDFVGHIGGDDFVVVTHPDRDEIIASESILSFNDLIQFHYTREDRDRGYIIARDRKGNLTQTPLMSISIAIANNKEHEIHGMVELMEIISEVKSYIKTLSGSNFLVDRRGPAKKEVVNMESENVKRFGYRPLGQILIEFNVLNSKQLEIALSKHWSTGQRIGQSIINLGMASTGDIARALEVQLNIPHFNIKDLDKNGMLKEFIHKIPFDEMKAGFFVPVNKDKDVISLAMVNPNDIEVIDKVRNFSGCNVAPFFVLEHEFEGILEKITKLADKGL